MNIFVQKTVICDFLINLDKYFSFGYCIGIDARKHFSLSDGSGFGKNVIKSAAGMSSSVDIGNKKRDILILGKGPTDGLGNTTLPAEKYYCINFTKQQKKFCLGFCDFIFVF